MPSFSANFGGSVGAQYRIVVDITLLGQEPSNNRSLVRQTVYVQRLGTAKYYFEPNTTDNHFTFNGGQVDANWIGGYDFRDYTVKYIVQDYDGWVYHNADGTKTAYFDGYCNLANGPYLYTAVAGGNYTLPTLATIPDVQTGSATNIAPTTSVVWGNVSNSGNATIIQRGIYYSSVSSNPTSAHSRQTVVGTTGGFNATLSGLTANTLYYYRAYAINSQGTGYGVVGTFTTAVTPYASLIYNNANPYADGKLMRDTGGGWADVASGDLYFRTFSEQGATTVPQNSLDPSTIIENALDYFNSNGGIVTYSNDSIDDTGTLSSYSFVSQSIFEVINKCLQLAPYNWYWYIDPATNLLHFHENNNQADHTLVLGKDIKSANVVKRGEDIVNVIYFTGGDTGGGSILYRKYQNSYSIGIYGQRAIKVVDERVTDIATAELIANNILGRQSLPEIRLQCSIADSNVNSGAYDIESIQVGDVVNIQNVRGSIGSSLFDVALFDVDCFDFNVSKITSMNLQVVRKEYKAEQLNITCSTIPPEITKRIEDINRSLKNAQTINNPDTPS